MTSRFKEASELLKGSNATNWKLISITIDPDHDQLNILNDYRQAWEFDSDRAGVSVPIVPGTDNLTQPKTIRP